MQVQLFIPCFIDQLYPETAINMTKILNNLNITSVYNPKQTCCGQLLFNSGYWTEACDLATKFLRDFDASSPILSPSASCIGYVRNYFNELHLPAESEEKYKKLKNNFYELSDFIVNYLKISSIKGTFKHTITFHDSCSALREYGIKTEPRQLLKNIDGLIINEMVESETCCGFGGTFSVKNEPISVAMAEQKVEHALKTGAEYIVSTEISCLMHLSSYIQKQNLPIKALSVTDLLALAMEG